MARSPKSTNFGNFNNVFEYNRANIGVGEVQVINGHCDDNAEVYAGALHQNRRLEPLKASLSLVPPRPPYTNYLFESKDEAINFVRRVRKHWGARCKIKRITTRRWRVTCDEESKFVCHREIDPLAFNNIKLEGDDKMTRFQWQKPITDEDIEDDDIDELEEDSELDDDDDDDDELEEDSELDVDEEEDDDDDLP